MSLACECLSVSFIEDGDFLLSLNFSQYTTEGFPGYAYTATDTENEIVFTIYWDVENEYWALSNDSNETILVLTGVGFDECPYGQFELVESERYSLVAISSECIELDCECIRINVYVNVAEDLVDTLQFQLNQSGSYNGVYFWSYDYDETTYFIWFNTSSSSWVISSGLGITDGISAELNVSGCPFGEWESFEAKIPSIISFECQPDIVVEPIEYPDAENCDPFEPCKYSNLLKRNRVSLSKEISAISKREVYGFNCEDSWKTIFTKSMIIDALSCLPYGIYTEEEERCLIEKLNDKCDC